MKRLIVTSLYIVIFTYEYYISVVNSILLPSISLTGGAAINVIPTRAHIRVLTPYSLYSFHFSCYDLLLWFVAVAARRGMPGLVSFLPPQPPVLMHWLLASANILPMLFTLPVQGYKYLRLPVGLSQLISFRNVNKVKYILSLIHNLLTGVGIIHSLERTTRDHQRWQFLGNSYLILSSK